MLPTTQFGPQAQTPEQRARVLEQMLAYYAQMGIKLSPHVVALHQRYVAGELSWTDVCALRAAA
ncbi:hypothetical protein [Hymenobacter mucosus]|uniref:Antitoxin VbhA domain-containing protein n=1 Tax=Hymenobacter mucosus TaxID=1411120 RepID=A0A238ZFF1_9BACT|nr:hypothetical protein [Hymenobacter mucosus]SNR81414.1 hypothetical protein SAMN06269173_107135 [Hymenobacter mucosus]